MEMFKYFMPTKLYFGENCISKNKDVLKEFGNKAIIFTGKNSAKKNGSLEDVTLALNELGKDYIVFDEVEENPSLETIGRAGKLGVLEKVDFVIGIGGGSPMDAAKAASFLISNPSLSAEGLFGDKPLSHVPLIEIPTTAGTGSEVTPYSVVTLPKEQTKSSVKQHAFAEVAFLDAKYMMGLSENITASTAIDALSHLIEGYTCVRANYLSDKMAEMGFCIFKECIESIKNKEYTLEIRERLLLASTVGGIVISQTGTSLPHSMGYPMTYFKNIPHGRANGMLTREYLKIFKNKEKVQSLISILGFKTIDELGDFFDSVLESNEKFTEDDYRVYTEIIMSNPTKLTTFSDKLDFDDVYRLYKDSLSR